MCTDRLARRTVEYPGGGTTRPARGPFLECVSVLLPHDLADPAFVLRATVRQWPDRPVGGFVTRIVAIGHLKHASSLYDCCTRCCRATRPGSTPGSAWAYVLGLRVGRPMRGPVLIFLRPQLSATVLRPVGQRTDAAAPRRPCCWGCPRPQLCIAGPGLRPQPCSPIRQTADRCPRCHRTPALSTPPLELGTSTHSPRIFRGRCFAWLMSSPIRRVERMAAPVGQGSAAFLGIPILQAAAWSWMNLRHRPGARSCSSGRTHSETTATTTTTLTNGTIHHRAGGYVEEGRAMSYQCPASSTPYR